MQFFAQFFYTRHEIYGARLLLNLKNSDNRYFFHNPDNQRLVNLPRCRGTKEQFRHDHLLLPRFHENKG